MSYLKELVEKFYKTDDEDYHDRLCIVLEMIEYTVTYPRPDTVEEWELIAVDACVKRATSELEAKKEHLLAKRVNKIWKKRDQLLEIAENAHHVKGDYMDNMEYHEEIKWIRNLMKELDYQ
jgi:hypothetical protein